MSAILLHTKKHESQWMYFDHFTSLFQHFFIWLIVYVFSVELSIVSNYLSTTMCQCHTFNRWIVKKDGVRFMSSTQILVIVHKFNIQITKFTVQYPPLLWSFQVFWWWSLFLIIKRSYQNKGWKSSKIKILKFSRLRFVPRRSC